MMKRYCFVFAAVLATVILCGCGSEKDFSKMMLQAKNCMKKGQLKDALSYSLKAQKCQPNSPEAFVMTALAYESNQKTKEALAEIQKAANIAPKSYFVQYTYGRLLYKSKKNQQSIAALKKAIDLNPKKAEARELLARVASEEKDYTTAFIQYRELGKLDPKYKKNSIVWNETGIFLYQVSKDLRKSLASFRYALKLDEKNPSIILNTAILYDKCNDRRRARENYQKYLDETKHDPSLSKKRAAVNARLRKI